MRTISLYAQDSSGVSVYSVRHLLVDNHEPADPGVPVPVVKTATATDLAWELAMDGTTPADRYGLWIWRVKTAAEYAADGSEKLVEESSAEVTEPSYALTTAPCTRYWASIRAFSPLDHLSGLVAVTENFTSRPLLGGTYSVTKSGSNYKTTVNLAVTPPNFAVHAPAQYTWSWVFANGVTGTANTAAPEYSLVSPAAKTVNPVRVWVDISYQPIDRLSSDPALTVKSNTVGPTPTSTGSGTLGVGSW
jgi:hypothetical protein